MHCILEASTVLFIYFQKFISKSLQANIYVKEIIWKMKNIFINPVFIIKIQNTFQQYNHNKHRIREEFKKSY